MYAYLFLFMFTIGAGTAASVGIININNKSQQTSKALEDVRIMALWEANIGDALEYAGPNNELVPPIGTNQSGKIGVHYPPSWIIAPRTNAYGRAIIYCPVSKTFGLNEKLTKKILSNQGQDYAVNTLSYKNKEYVIASDVVLDSSIPRSSVLAMLISPGPDENPKCSDVIYNTEKGYFYLKGNIGIVKVVTPAHKLNHGQEETPPVGEAKNISQIINDWSKTSEKNLVIEVNDKDYFNDSVSVSKFDGDNSIILKSSTGQLTKIKSNGSNLSLNGVKILTDTVDISAAGVISVENGVFTLNNSNAPKVNIINSNLAAYGANETQSISSINGNLNFNGSKTTITTSGENIVLKNSKANIINGSNISIDVKSGKLPLSLLGNSDLYIDSSSLNLKGTSSTSDAMILNDSTSRFTAINSTINLNSKSTYGIYTQGLMKLDTSSVLPNSTTTASLYITDGGKTHIEQSNIGASTKKSQYGVVIDSTSYTSGSNSYIYSTYTCVSGSGYNSSKSLPDKTIINIQWTCK